MPCVIIYSSTQACVPVLTLALTMQDKGHELRPLSLLPAPRPGRMASLQLEMAGLQQDERTIRWTLSQYTEGLRLPDACRERDLREDLDVTLCRQDAVSASLKAMKGELSNG